MCEFRSKTDETQVRISGRAQVIVFWKRNPGSERQRGIGGENKSKGDDINGHLFLMKSKALLTLFFCMD